MAIFFAGIREAFFGGETLRREDKIWQFGQSFFYKHVSGFLLLSPAAAAAAAERRIIFLVFRETSCFFSSSSFHVWE